MKRPRKAFVEISFDDGSATRVWFSDHAGDPLALDIETWRDLVELPPEDGFRQRTGGPTRARVELTGRFMSCATVAPADPAPAQGQEKPCDTNIGPECSYEPIHPPSARTITIDDDLLVDVDEAGRVLGIERIGGKVGKRTLHRVLKGLRIRGEAADV